jgi:phosphopantothenoylcysteine decarboxylase / phosphopantothenate---cysteine ligase
MKPTVLIGITGGIAAYKIPFLVRILVNAGIDTRIVMSDAATKFVTPLTLATLSGNPVLRDMWADLEAPSVQHIEIADNSNLAVIAPATANIIGKFASGIADNLLSTIFPALKCPVLICPSMNINMFRNPIVQRNLGTLKEMGYHVMEPESGYLACGWSGEGRLPEPEAIAEKIFAMLSSKDLKGKRILVTAGPTEEPLDPVRFISNKSSGKMGVAIARRAAARGADVTLVSGPMRTDPPMGIKLLSVRTARQMHDAVINCFSKTDVVIKAAAVADFRPESESDEKIKKDRLNQSISLVKNPDILHALGQMKQKGQILVGFAAETHNPVDNAREKLFSKNLDMMVVNDVTMPGAGFDCDTNIVRFLYASREDEQLEIMSKETVADLILDRVLSIEHDYV